MSPIEAAIELPTNSFPTPPYCHRSSIAVPDPILLHDKQWRLILVLIVVFDNYGCVLQCLLPTKRTYEALTGLCGKKPGGGEW